jgi:hypothetical protein
MQLFRVTAGKFVMVCLAIWCLLILFGFTAAGCWKVFTVGRSALLGLGRVVLIKSGEKFVALGALTFSMAHSLGNIRPG